MIKNNPDKDFVEILRKLKEYNIEGLPPGGGLASKYCFDMLYAHKNANNLIFIVLQGGLYNWII